MSGSQNGQEEVVLGLCASCLHSRPIRSSKGSTFVRCELSFTDPRFPRYPVLPVIQCEGYTPTDGWPFEAVVDDFVAVLAARDYVQLERRTNGVRLSAAELAFAVERYGRRIIVPPSGSTSTLDVVPIAGAEPPAWSVNVPLWTLEEGPSDLTLELTVRTSANGQYVVEIDDLHVL